MTSCCPVCAQPLPTGTRSAFCPVCSLLGALGEQKDELGVTEDVRVLGDYELLEVIGRGGMGVVWRARQRSLKRLVALKLIVSGELASESARRRFREEALAAARLRHPHIVAIHEIGQVDGQSFFSMELVEGHTLADRAAKGPLPAAEAARWVLSIAEAVQYAHENGVLHRDLKPSNLLVDEAGVVKVTDFGLARRLDESERHTLTGDVLGSPAYLAPEQARGERSLEGVWTDVYGLGAILYELLTGRPPFLGETPVAVLRRVLEAEPIGLRALNPSLSVDLESVCLKCLEKDPGRRYSSAEALAEELRRFLRGEPVEVRPIGWLGRAGRWSARHPAKAGLVAALSLLLLTLLIVPSVAYFKVRSAEQETVAQLRATLLTQAWAIRRSGQPGQRQQSLQAIREAEALGGDVQFRARLRDEAIAALALNDVSVERATTLPPEPDPTLLSVNESRTHFAHGSFRGPLRLVRAADGAEVSRIEIAPRTLQHVLDFSPDGRFVAARHGREIVVWDWTNRTAVISQPAWLNRFSFRADSRLFAVARTDGTVAAFQLPGGELAWTWSESSAARIQALAFAPDGTKLAWAVGEKRGVELRDAESGRLVVSLPTPAAATTLAWSKDGRALAAGDEGGRVHVWFFSDDFGDVEPRQFDLHAGFVRTLAWSPDGQLLASSGADDMVRLTLARTARVGLEIQGAAFHLQFDAGGRVGPIWQQRVPQWLRVTNSTVFAEGKVNLRLGSEASIALDNDGRRLVVVGSHEIRWWDAGTLTEVDQARVPEISSARFQPGNQLMVATTNSVLRWNGLERRWSKISTVGGDFPVFSQNGEVVALPSYRQDLIRVVRGGTNALTLDQPRVTDVALSPDAGLLAAGSLDRGMIQLWNLATGEAGRSWPDAGDNRVAFSPDGRWLAQFGLRLRVWKAPAFEPDGVVIEFEANTRSCPAAFSADGRLFAATAGDSEIHLFMVPEWRRVAALEAPKAARINRLAWSFDGSRIAVTTSPGHVQVWNLRELRRQLGQLALDWD